MNTNILTARSSRLPDFKIMLKKPENGLSMSSHVKHRGSLEAKLLTASTAL